MSNEAPDERLLNTEDAVRLADILSAHVIDVQQLNTPRELPEGDGPETRVYQLLQSPCSLPGKVPVGSSPVEEAVLNDQFLEEAARRILSVRPKNKLSDISEF
ncbi:hypothetical protein HAP41_0000009790 [Bradyrhizobium barranii subsp. apii]|uniref:Uncharacterized protein n=1 Tax=Bradyrhizobium barranii subsp. apii TaxID=2819348 RepID=A0A8T5VL67_9BRAD|nr:hypothetical protein [Bradyrhizobium barranii]UPT89231.1 hypothetical protein HAP41_0000009790 [Bradyrhizobium barranii subsp. apii]